MPEARGHKVSISVFVDSDIAGYNFTRCRYIGLMILSIRIPSIGVARVR